MRFHSLRDARGWVGQKWQFQCDVISEQPNSDDVTKIYFRIFMLLARWSESAPQNRHVLTISDEHCQNGMKYDHLKTENLP